MNIKLTKDWGEFAAGSVVEVDEETGKSLVLAQVGKEYSVADEAEAKAAKEAADAQSKALEDKVAKSIKEALKDLPAQDGIHLNIQVDPEGKDKPFKSMGEQMHAIMNHETGKGSEESHNRLKAAAGSNELVDSEGGFLVQQDFTEQLQQNAQETGVIASRVSTQEVSGNGLKWNELDDYDRTKGNHPVTTYWTPEAGTKTASQSDFIRRDMQLEKLIGLYYATDELLEDATGLAGEISGWFGGEFGWQMDEAIYDGNGTGKPLGILNSNALVSVAKETSQTAKTIVAENVVKMFARMPSRFLGGAAWYINQDVWPQLPLMTIGDQPIFLPPTGLIDAPAGMLLGKPIVLVEQAKTVGTKGDIMFANMAEYKMIRKGGIKADTSIHVKFVTDETAFRFVMRTNGQTKWSKSMTPQNGTNNLSPFVTLDARA
jgi:HK97 family phage major capsid protein